MKRFIRFLKDEEGATAVEYSIMIALIAIVIFASVVILGGGVNNLFSTAANRFPK